MKTSNWPRLLLSAGLLLTAYFMYAVPVEVCPWLPDEEIPFPCHPRSFPAHGVLYLLYAGIMMWVFCMAALPTCPLTIRAVLCAKISVLATALSFLLHIPSFGWRDVFYIVPFSMPISWLLTLLPFTLIPLRNRVLAWGWLWRGTEEVPLTRRQMIRIAVIFPIIAISLVNCSASSNLLIFTWP